MCRGQKNVGSGLGRDVWAEVLGRMGEEQVREEKRVRTEPESLVFRAVRETQREQGRRVDVGR